VGGRHLGWLLRASDRAMEPFKLGLAFDSEQHDLAAAARLALERPAALHLNGRL